MAPKGRGGVLECQLCQKCKKPRIWRQQSRLILTLLLCSVTLSKSFDLQNENKNIYLAYLTRLLRMAL